ncbi:MAG: cupin domain-containing protein [Verrucomicrobia bacterium]|jgi:quercetin dioxygenase-like cupin family protein|nr:cupin domain-containing protein [Verrucomicrobiota bacterium]MBT7067621.1 cupin domain-containing protein [Verrucomicrobiota bacterium]MBT7701576.1 cupin domain-containing protein [Verrucomicrobiota bacterium]
MSGTDEFKGVAMALATSVDYSSGSIVSKTLMNKKTGTLTLFAFDAGQGLSEHTSPFDATVYVLDGEATITIDGEGLKAKTGEMVIMPANIPHDVQAEERFKMLLIMIR